MSERPRSTGLLLELATHVVEAALEAEMVEHLVDAKLQRPQRGRRNSRNGTRSKTVRSLVGALTVDVPRDRWGTFQPMTVGKWQREVVGIDRVLLPLAAKGAPQRDLLALLAQAYPPDASHGALSRIATSVRARLHPWHERPLPRPFPVLHVHLSTLRNYQGRATGFPILSVVGATAPEGHLGARRELLSLHAMRPEHGSEPWAAVIGDLRRRGLDGVRSVVGAAAVPFRHAAGGLWPSTEQAALTA